MGQITLGLSIAGVFFFMLGAGYWGIVAGALNRMTRAEAREAKAKRLGGKHVVKIVARRPAALSAALLIRIACAVAATALLTAVFAAMIPAVGLAALAGATVTGIMLLLISALVPASFGYSHPLNVLAACSHQLWLVTRFTSLIVRRREPEDEEEREERQEDQLAVMVERVSEFEAVEDDERELLHSVFELDSTYLREVMVPRTDIISIKAQAPLDKALSLFSRSGFSRVPVIGESVDDALGVLYLKDVIRRVHHRNDADAVTAAEVMREAAFVPETKRVDDMLQQMQASAVHIALVVDEYGGIAGLVTIEDLLEELVGEMVDEHDKAEPEVEDLGDGRYRVPARMPIDELGELWGVELEDEDVDSVGGLLAKANGRVPIAGAEGQIYGVTMVADRFGGRRNRLSTVIVSYEPPSEDAERREGE